MNQNNNIGICYQQWGKREVFSRGTLSDAPLMREPRWFKFGKNCNIEVGKQIEIGKELAGDVALGNAIDDPVAIPMHIAKRRKESYAKFYRGDKVRSRCYQSWDVPCNADKFTDLWDDVALSNTKQDRIC